MANNSKDIELVIRTRDLSSRPLEEIGDAVSKLEKSLSDLGPAAQRGEVKLGELQRIAGKLEQALKGLAANQAVIERFNTLNTAIQNGEAKLTEYAARVAEAQKALDSASKPTRALTDALKRQQTLYARQEKELAKLNTQLDKLRDKAEGAGINLEDLAGSQAKIDAAVTRTTAAYAQANRELDSYDDNQRRAAAAAKAAADEQARAAEKAAQAQAMAQYRAAQDAKQAAGDAAFQKQKQAIEAVNAEATRLRQSAEYVQFWTQSLDAADKQASDLASFRKIGQDAEASAQGFQRNRVELDRLAIANKKAGASVREIVDPQAELVKTLNGMESAVSKAVSTYKDVDRQLKLTGKSSVDLKTELQQLGQVQSNATGIASLIDRFRNVRSAAADAAVEMRRARADVTQYAQAIQTANAPNQELVRQLEQAQARLAASERNYRQFSAAAQKLRGDLAATGVNMRDLTGEMARVESVARSATQSTNDIAAAMKRAGQAAQQGGNGFNFFTQGGRTTLSLAQRLKGEILALTATYVGLYGAISGVQSVLDAVELKSGIDARLSVAFGKEGVGGAIEYLNQQVERLGIEFPKAAQDFSDMAIAAKSAGFTLDETKFVFESFAEAGKVLRLSPDNLSGVFKALNQIMSKSKVQAEELRGQLGDRLSGAFNVLAESMGISATQLDKLIEAGKVPDDFLLLFAQRYREIVAGELPAATKTAASEIARFKNEIFQLQLTIAESGFLEAFTKAVKKLTEFLKSDNGKKFAENLGKGLTEVTNGFVYLLDNIEAVKDALIAVGAVWATSALAGMAVNIIAATKEFAAMYALIAAKSPAAASALRMVGGALFAGFAGWSIGTYLREEFVSVKKAGAIFVGAIDAWITTAKGLAQAGAAEYVGFWEDGFARAYNAVARTLKDLLELTASFAEKLGATDLANKLLTTAGEITEKVIVGIGERSAAIRAQLKQDLLEIQKNTADLMAAYDEEENARNKSKAAPSTNASAAPTDGQATLDPARSAALQNQARDLANSPSAAQVKQEEAAAKRRIALAEQVARDLDRIEQGIKERGAKTLEERLAAIDTEYSALVSKIDKLGGSEGAAAKARLDQLIVQRKAEETQKYYDDERKKKLQEFNALEQQINDRVQLRDAMITAENEKRRAGLITDLEAKENIAQITQQANGAIKQSADELTASVSAMITELEAVPEALRDEKAINSLKGIKANMETIKARTVETKNELITAAQVNEQWADGLAGSIMKLGEGFTSARDAFRQFASDFLKQIAQMILKTMILKALESSGFGGMVAGGVNAMAGSAHTGGIIGSTVLARKSIDPRIFANAPRYHSGGVVGLRKDEVPAILQTGEEVLTRTDPRNAKNGGATPKSEVKIVNMFDTASFVSEALNSLEGQQAVMNIVRANRGM